MDTLKKNSSKLVVILALAIFAFFIWQQDTKTQDKPAKTIAAEGDKQQQSKGSISRKSYKLAQKKFKEQVVQYKKAEEVKKGFFKVTNPAALAFAKNLAIANDPERGPGKTPAITKEQIAASPQLRSAIEAINNPKKFGTRLSALIAAAPFDKEKFLHDKEYREEYLNTAEPTRVYQVNDQSNYKLERISPYYQNVNQGESVELSVKGEPNMPISITSFDLGKFDNHLTFQTALADASGKAIFNFQGMPGTYNDTNILVSSPTSRGQVKFIVFTKIRNKKTKGDK